MLQRNESLARKHQREEEMVQMNKRLKKNDEKITWNLRDVLQARGHTVEEIMAILAQQPDRS